jgi:arginyl-tRNA synthetase
MLAWQMLDMKRNTRESSELKGDHLVGKYYVIYDKERREKRNIINHFQYLRN